MDKEAKSVIFISLLIIIVAFGLVFMQSKIHSTPPKNQVQMSTITYSYIEVIESNNINNCQYLDDKNLIESCNLKLKICNSDDCYLDKARFEQDERLCFKIEDTNKIALCSAAIKRSTILQSAVIDNDITICNNFEDQSSIDHCQDNFYMQKDIMKTI